MEVLAIVHLDEDFRKKPYVFYAPWALIDIGSRVIVKTKRGFKTGTVKAKTTVMIGDHTAEFIKLLCGNNEIMPIVYNLDDLRDDKPIYLVQGEEKCLSE